jgi:hypothetical protein
MDATVRWEALVATMLAEGVATHGNEGGAKRAFGSTSLKTDGRIFAMLVNDHLVVKVPAARVQALVDDGAGERFDPGHGRIQKEWVVVADDEAEVWRALATEAERFVSRRDR